MSRRSRPTPWASLRIRRARRTRTRFPVPSSRATAGGEAPPGKGRFAKRRRSRDRGRRGRGRGGERFAVSNLERRRLRRDDAFQSRIELLAEERLHLFGGAADEPFGPDRGRELLRRESECRVEGDSVEEIGRAGRVRPLQRGYSRVDAKLLVKLLAVAAAS